MTPASPRAATWKVPLPVLVLTRVVVVGVLYAALNLAAAHFKAFAGVSMLYPASAAGVVFAMVWTWETAVAVFVATLLTPWTGDNPPLVMLAFAVGNTVEALLPALVLRPARSDSRIHGVAFVVLWACVVNTVLNALIGIGPQVLAGLKPAASILVWWLADAMAIGIFAIPFLLRLRPELFFPEPRIVSWSFVRELRLSVLSVALLVVSVSVLVFVYDTTYAFSFNWPVLLYLLPLTLLLGRGGLAAVATVNAVIACAYLTTLALESRHLGVFTLRSPDLLLVVYGNLVFFLIVTLTAGTMRSENLWLLHRLRERWAELRETFDSTVTALAGAIEATDPTTEQHVERVSSVATAVARELGLGERDTEIVRYGAILHDVGKIAVPRYILTKTGPLDEREHDLMEQHIDFGAQILEHSGLPEEVVPIVRYHEERWDGRTSGRFKARFGLKGEEIPLGARIVAVADAFDAMTTDRPYREAMSDAEAIEELRREAGHQFDPGVVDAFVRVLGGHRGGG